LLFNIAMKAFFEYIYDGLNLALDTLETLYIVAIVGLSIIIYLKTGSVFLSMLFLIAASFLGSKLLENTVFIVISLFLSLLVASIYYTHTLWPFTIVYTGVVYAYWYYFGKDPPLGSIKPEYTAGEELDPLTASFLLKEEIDTFDIVACIYNLVRKGHIEVEIQKNDIYFKRKASDRLLSRPEIFLLDRVFVMTGVEIATMGIELKADEFPEVVSFGHVLEKILEWLPALERVVEEHVVESGYYDYAPVLQKKYTKYLAGVLMGGFLLIIFFALPFIITLGPFKFLFYIFVPGLVPPVATYILSLYVTKRTRKGMEAYRKVLGFREFLKRVERPRLAYLIKEKSVDVEELFVYMIALRALGFFDRLKVVLTDFKELNEKIQVYMKLDAFIRRNLRKAIEKAQREKRRQRGEWDILGGGGFYWYITISETRSQPL